MEQNNGMGIPLFQEHLHEINQKFQHLQVDLLSAGIHFFHRHIRNDKEVEKRMEGNDSFKLFYETQYHNKKDLNKIFVDSVSDCSPIHVCSFILSILHQGIFSVTAFIVSVIYLSRFKESSQITLHACTWRPLFLTTLLVADKMWEDKPVRNSSLAKLFPVLSNIELNEMEYKLLVQVGFNIVVKPDLFTTFCEKLLAESVNPEIARNVKASEYAKVLALETTNVLTSNPSPQHHIQDDTSNTGADLGAPKLLNFGIKNQTNGSQRGKPIPRQLNLNIEGLTHTLQSSFNLKQPLLQQRTFTTNNTLRTNNESRPRSTGPPGVNDRKKNYFNNASDEQPRPRSAGPPGCDNRINTRLQQPTISSFMPIGIQPLNKGQSLPMSSTRQTSQPRVQQKMEVQQKQTVAATQDGRPGSGEDLMEAHHVDKQKRNQVSTQQTQNGRATQDGRPFQDGTSQISSDSKIQNILMNKPILGMPLRRSLPAKTNTSQATPAQQQVIENRSEDYNENNIVAGDPSMKTTQQQPSPSSAQPMQQQPNNFQPSIKVPTTTPQQQPTTVGMQPQLSVFQPSIRSTSLPRNMGTVNTTTMTQQQQILMQQVQQRQQALQPQQGQRFNGTITPRGPGTNVHITTRANSAPRAGIGGITQRKETTQNSPVETSASSSGSKQQPQRLNSPSIINPMNPMIMGRTYSPITSPTPQPGLQARRTGSPGIQLKTQNLIGPTIGFSTASRGRSRTTQGTIPSTSILQQPQRLSSPQAASIMPIGVGLNIGRNPSMGLRTQTS